jgi:hypothetical protein
MKSSLYVAALIAAATAACGESPANYPDPVRYETRVEVHPETRIVFTPDPSPSPGPRTTIAVPVRADIVVTPARKLDRPTEMVGVIDEHEPSGRQDAALALIRERAAAMGADAVLGVEFHHGDEKDDPTHLSGLAVRYVDHRP